MIFALFVWSRQVQQSCTDAAIWRFYYQRQDHQGWVSSFDEGTEDF